MLMGTGLGFQFVSNRFSQVCSAMIQDMWHSLCVSWCVALRGPWWCFLKPKGVRLACCLVFGPTCFLGGTWPLAFLARWCGAAAGWVMPKFWGRPAPYGCGASAC